MKELKLKSVVAKNNRTYYYAFNAITKQWQRISKDRFQVWLYQYFGNTAYEVLASDKHNETCYLVTPAV